MPASTALDQSLAVVFALLTACTNALALSVQHVASTRKKDHASTWQLVLFLFRQPLWLAGWLALVGSLIFQALALHFGPMSEVQPLLVSELIVALVLRRLWIRQDVRGLAWLGALVTIGGLSIFLAASAPKGHAVVPPANSWVSPVVVFAALSFLLVLFAQRGSPSRRAGLLGAATGVAWAIEATFIKATTDTLAHGGVDGALHHWFLYAFVVGGIAGLLCEQAALHVGPLKSSQPFLVIVDPLVSVALGVWLFGESLQRGALHVGVASVGFLVMCVGVVALTQSAPSSMKAEVHRL